MNTLKTNLMRILSSACNKVLECDPRSKEKLKKFENTLVAIEITDLTITLYLFIEDDGIIFLNEAKIAPHATLKGKSFDLFNKRYEAMNITGNVELCRNLQDLLKHIEIDHEAQLANFIGGSAAHFFIKKQHAFKDSMQHTKKAMMSNVSEYLTEEAKLLPPKVEVENFFDDIDELKNKIARLEAKLQQKGYL